MVVAFFFWNKPWTQNSFTYFSEAVVQRCPVKKVFLEISQNPQKKICARVSFNKVADLTDLNFQKFQKLQASISRTF